MGKYRWYLLNSAIFCYAYDFFLTMWKPVWYDIDFIIRRVDQAWDYFKQPGGINDVGQSDFAFMEQVEKDLMNATEFFDMLGDLFTNGTLGHFEDERVGYVTFQRLYINVNGTSGLLVDKLVPLLKAFKSLESLWTYANYVFPFSSEDETLLNALRGSLQGLFSKSKAFFEELIEDTPKQLDGENHRSYLDDRCFSLGWKHQGHNDSFVDYTIKFLLRVLGPQCETEQRVGYDYDIASALQSNCFNPATFNHLCGGESNRCFHKFLIRYGNYDAYKYNVFVSNLAVFLLYERSIYAFCTRIQEARDPELPHRDPSAIAKRIRTIRERLLEAKSMLTEDSPCHPKPTTTPELTTLTGQGQQTVNATTVRTTPVRQENMNSTTVPKGQQATNATTNPLESVQWVDDAKKAAELAIGDRTFMYPTPDKALDTYAAVGTRMLDLLNRSNPTHMYKALVFFPAYDESEYCIKNTPNGDFYHSMYNNVRYVVARYSQKELDAANRMWQQNVSASMSKLQQAFRHVSSHML